MWVEAIKQKKARTMLHMHITSNCAQHIKSHQYDYVMMAFCEHEKWLFSGFNERKNRWNVNSFAFIFSTILKKNCLWCITSTTEIVILRMHTYVIMHTCMPITQIQISLCEQFNFHQSSSTLLHTFKCWLHIFELGLYSPWCVSVFIYDFRNWI